MRSEALRSALNGSWLSAKHIDPTTRSHSKHDNNL